MLKIVQNIKEKTRKNKEVEGPNFYGNVLNNVQNKNRLIIGGSGSGMRRASVQPQIIASDPPYTILSKNVNVSMDRKKTEINNNTFVIGMAGSGKSRSVFLPNLLESNSNYVITDVYGDYYYKTRDFFKSQGYDVKVLDLTFGKIDIKSEDVVSYNPFAYTENETDIDNIVQSFLYATNARTELGSYVKANYDPIFETAEKTFMNICALYLYYTKGTAMTFSDILELLVDIPSDKIGERLIKMVEFVEEKRKNGKDIEGFKTFVVYNQKMYKALMVSLSIRLIMFQSKEVKDMTTANNIDLEGLTRKKQVLFVVTSPTNAELNFLASILHMQLYNITHRVENFTPGCHIKCILDDFSDTIDIKDFAQMMTTCRIDNAEMKMSYMIGIQALVQLKEKYPNDWELIIANCDSLVFLGTRNIETTDWMCERLGKNTTRDEIMRMHNEDCIVLMRGMKPIRNKKYSLENHPNYKYIQK